MEEYRLEIKRGHTDICDYCMDIIKPHIEPPYLDIGCNSGWLLSEIQGGYGIDQSNYLIDIAKSKGYNVACCSAESIPAADGIFTTSVLINILEQCQDWRQVLKEAIRMSNKIIIGINPIPDKSPWGREGGWVRSIISTDDMVKFCEEVGVMAEIQEIEHDKYFFKLTKVANENN